MNLKHQTTEVPKARGSERPKFLKAQGPRDLHLNDFGTDVDDEGVMHVWIELFDVAAEHTVHVTARYDRAYGSLENVSVEGVELPAGHAVRERVEHDRMVLGCAERHTAFEREAALDALYDL